MKRTLLLSTFMLFVTSNTFAQTYTEIFEGGWGKGMNFSKPTFTDLDSDGLMDLIVGNQDGKMKHYEQDAIHSSTFTLISDSFNGIDVGEFATPCFIDFDNDGLLDMIIGGQTGNLNHYEQDDVGSISFTRITNNFNGIDVDWDSSPCFTDLDKDGLLDMIVGERYGNLNHYEQDAVGSAIFNLLSDSLSGIVAGERAMPIFTDLDNDNLLDLIVGESSGDLHYYEQDGTGSLSFTLVSENLSGIDVGKYSSPCFADFDEDGMLDLLIGEMDGNLNHYQQDTAGSTTFNLITEKFVSGVIDVGVEAAPTIADLDNDGLLDLIIGAKEGILNHYEQDTSGSSTFNLISYNFSVIDDGSYSTPYFTDLDNDGLHDLIVGESDGNLNHYEQDAVGSTTFNLISDSFSGIVVGNRSAPCVIDLDSDGLLDMIVGNRDGYLKYYKQDAIGSTGFTLVSDSLSGIDVGNYSAPSFTDLDSDGLLDMIVGENLNHYEQDAVGSTSFTLISDNLNEIHVSSAKPIFADINGDGLEDLIVGVYDGGVHYFQRDQDVGIISDYISGSNALPFQLFPNYPNPFNPITTIRYDLLKSVNVNVSIYNLLGQRIKVLENGFQQAGSYAMQWDGKDNYELSLSSGIYICRIQAGEFVQSIKLMLLK